VFLSELRCVQIDLLNFGVGTTGKKADFRERGWETLPDQERARKKALKSTAR